MLEDWASMKSLKRKGRTPSDVPNPVGRSLQIDFHEEKYYVFWKSRDNIRA